jgi:O-antigen/teichoic acid export membrane protein
MAFSFVPSCLIVYFYPKMVQAFSESKQAGRASVKNLSKLFFAVNGGVFLLMLLGAPLLIWIGFGDKYMNVVSVFRLLSVNYLIHAVQSLLSHVLAVIKRLKANLLLSLLSGLANIGLNILLIPLWGSMGAALATLSVTCLVTLLYFIYLRKFYKEA